MRISPTLTPCPVDCCDRVVLGIAPDPAVAAPPSIGARKAPVLVKDGLKFKD